ncbi:MAG: hypothetical protein ACI8Z1_003487 [Candidatus Azotimanducaceae bacterium]|jgi:hypothetical protein
MLLVSSPTKQDLIRILNGLQKGSISREEAVTWQKAVFAEYGWQVSINDQDGYWYFYSLAFANLEFPDGQFLRQVDWEEYLADMNQVPGSALSASLRHLRTFEIDRNGVRWPVAMISDRSDLMADMPSSRGTFERRLDMVEHCHLQFENNQFLLVKQFDEMTGQLLLLASSRNPEQAEALLEVLGVTDYILP